MKTKLYIAAAIFATTFISTSCTSDSTLDDNLQVEQVEILDTTTEEVFESPDSDYHLPSALQIAGIFKRSGMQFNAEAMNPTENASTYTTAAAQMLNFGVYSADIAFCVTNNQTNEARQLIVVIKDLAETQGMAAIFDNKDLMDKFDASLGIKDSIEYVMIEIHERTEEYMAENQMTHSSAVHFAGAWIEGMHLGATDYMNNPENKNVSAQIIEQMEILNNIIKGLKDPKNNELAIKDVISDLETIETTYTNFESVQNYNSEESLVELNLSPEEFKELIALIQDLRAKVIHA